jgi:hypothetical protein
MEMKNSKSKRFAKAPVSTSIGVGFWVIDHNHGYDPYPGL